MTVGDEEIRRVFEQCGQETVDAFAKAAHRFFIGEMTRNQELLRVLAEIEAESTEENIKKLASEGIKNNRSQDSVFVA